MTTNKKWTFVTLLIAFVFISHLSTAQEINTSTTYSSKACYANGLSRKVQCYSLKRTSPLLPSHENNITFELGGIIVPSQATTPLNDPLVILVGGPGQGASDLAGAILPLFNRVRNKRDIVFFDIRGTGKSLPLSCTPEKVPPVLSHLPLDEVISHVRNCIHKNVDSNVYNRPFDATPEGLKIDSSIITGFTSMTAVEDLEALRIAIAAKQLNLWGVSYGTRLAQLYMRSYPKRVRSAVLDAVVPFSPSYLKSQPKNALLALTTLTEDCRKSVDCNMAFPDFDPISLLNSLSNQEPIAFRHPITDTVTRTTTSRAIIAQVVFTALYQTQSRAFIPWALSQAVLHQRWEPMAALALDNSEYLGIKTIYDGAHYSVVCSGELRRNPYSAINFEDNRDDPFFNHYPKKLLTAICDNWPIANNGELLPIPNPLTADIPVLMISGGLDPITPPSMAEAAAQEFSNSRHLIIPLGGHMNSSRPCAQELVADFIAEPKSILIETETDFDGTCNKETYSLPFITNTLGAIPMEPTND